MELKRPNVAVIAADHATSAGFFDKYRLHLLPMANDSVGAAPFTAVITAALENEYRLAMVWTHHHDLEDARVSRGTARRRLLPASRRGPGARSA